MKYHFPFPPRTLRCNVSFNNIICPSIQCEQENMISHLQWVLWVIFWRARSALLCFWGLFLCLSNKTLSLPCYLADGVYL